MKTTLENSYCRPQNEAEWKILCSLPSIKSLRIMTFEEIALCVSQNRLKGFALDNRDIIKFYGSKERQTEIPVQHFLDLLNDAIVPWRLEGIGFNESETCYELRLTSCAIVFWSETDIDIDKDGQLIPLHITTFTDLLTLIRFLK